MLVELGIYLAGGNQEGGARADVRSEAVGVVDFVGLRVAVSECCGYAGTPAALSIAGMNKESIGRGREDVADMVG